MTKLEVTGLSLCPEPINGKRIHDRYFDPLWAEIEKLGVALCFHPPARPKQDQVANKFFGHPNANIVALALRNPVELIQAVSSFCAGGVLEKISQFASRLFWKATAPGCRGCFIASMSAPSCMALWPMCRCRASRASISSRQCFISLDPDEYLVSDVVKRIGDDNIVVSTDYPAHRRAFSPCAG